MIITVSKNFSDFPSWQEAFVSYVTKLRQGYDIVMRNPQIEFNNCLTLIRLGDEGYALYGSNPRNQSHAVVETEENVLQVNASSAPDVERGLEYFAHDATLRTLRITFAKNLRLGLPECELELNKSRTLLVYGKDMLSAEEFAALQIITL
jgi:hypothetical protein